MIEFRKKVDGLLTGSQVRSIRKSLGLNQAEAARVFGGGPVAFSKYENDDVTQSEAMDKLLRLASRLPAAMDILQNPAHMIPDCSKSLQTIPELPIRDSQDLPMEMVYFHNPAG